MATVSQHGSDDHERNITAASIFYLGQFSKRIEATDLPPTKDIRFCFVDSGPLVENFKHLVSSRTIRGRKVEAVDIQSRAGVESIKSCEAVFIGAILPAKELAFIESLERTEGPKLLITNMTPLFPKAAFVLLFSENNRLRIRVNLSAAAKHDTAFDADLLELAIVDK